jgi:hypothetical protein
MNPISSQSFSVEDTNKLKKELKKINGFIIPLYIVITIACIYIVFGYQGNLDLDRTSSRIKFNKDDAETLTAAVDYIAMLILIATNYFFFKTLWKKVIPLVTDSRKKIKHLFSFRVEKAHLRDKNLILLPFQPLIKMKLKEAIYQQIKPGFVVEVCLTPSGYLLSISINNMPVPI